MSHPFLTDFSRRDFVKMSLASALGASCSGWLRALADSSGAAERQRSCILLWMNGGPSQLDTFDLKPDSRYGGPFKEIATAVPGIRIGEHLPQLARHTDHMAIIRSMRTKEGDHGRATYLARTGYIEQGAVRYPTLGSLVAKELGQTDAELPNFVSIAPFRFFSDQAFTPGFLGPAYGPLTVAPRTSFQPPDDDRLPVEDLAPPRAVGESVIRSRAQLLELISGSFNRHHAALATDTHRANYEQALRMMLSRAKAAFDLEEEPAALRAAYGRNRFGQGCLLARRLVERGVPFVEVSLANIPGNNAGWDTHQDNFEMVKRLCQVLDPAWATLMTDLKQRGLLDSTLIVWMGEFGRTPQINPFTGRDHYPVAWSTVLAGGGIMGGHVIGSTGKNGIRVEEQPVSIPDFLATVCTILGMDPRKENISDENRPIPLVDRGAKPITAITASIRV